LRPRATRLAQPRHQPARDARRDHRVARQRRLHSVRHLVRPRVLEQVTARAGQQRVEDLVVLDGDREDQDPRRGVGGHDSLDGLDSRHERHREVHHDDVGAQLGGELHSGATVRCLADDLDVVMLEQAPQPASEQRVVVDEDHAGARDLVQTSP
jgi:hypothetical protein